MELKNKIIVQLTILSKMYEEGLKSNQINYIQRKAIQSQLNTNNKLIENINNENE